MKFSNRKNQKGQSLIEYLILVAIVGVGTMGIIRVVGANVAVQFANVAKALGSGDDSNQISGKTIEKSMYSKRDLSDFLSGSRDTSSNNSSGGKNGGRPRGDAGSGGGKPD